MSTSTVSDCSYCDQIGPLLLGEFVQKLLQPESSPQNYGSPASTTRRTVPTTAAAPVCNFIANLVIGNAHRGQYVEGIVASDPFKMNAVQFTLRDDKGTSITVSVYNYPNYGGSMGMTVFKNAQSAAASFFKMPFDIRQGQRIRINNPFCKIAMDGQKVIRIDDFSTLVLY